MNRLNLKKFLDDESQLMVKVGDIFSAIVSNEILCKESIISFNKIKLDNMTILSKAFIDEEYKNGEFVRTSKNEVFMVYRKDLKTVIVNPYLLNDPVYTPYFKNFAKMNFISSKDPDLNILILEDVLNSIDTRVKDIYETAIKMRIEKDLNNGALLINNTLELLKTDFEDNNDNVTLPGMIDCKSIFNLRVDEYEYLFNFIEDTDNLTDSLQEDLEVINSSHIDNIETDLKKINNDFKQLRAFNYLPLNISQSDITEKILLFINTEKRNAIKKAITNEPIKYINLINTLEILQIMKTKKNLSINNINDKIPVNKLEVMDSISQISNPNEIEKYIYMTHKGTHITFSQIDSIMFRGKEIFSR